MISNVRYHIDDHKLGAFELGAPTSDVLDVNWESGRGLRDNRSPLCWAASQPAHFANWVREFAQFMIAPLSPNFNLDRYDRELHRPFPPALQFAPRSDIWRREHAISDAAMPAVPGRDKIRPAATSRGRSLEFQ